MGYVYLIRDINNDIYKIGVTRSKNSKRIKQLQTGNSSELEVVIMYETQYPFKLEKMLHAYYVNSRIRGEWFTLSNPNEFIGVCERFQNTIYTLLDNPYFCKGIK